MVPTQPPRVARSAGRVAGLAAAALLAACSAKPPAAVHHAEAAAQEAANLPPPRLDTVRAEPSGVLLSGVAQAGGRVRLATPGGVAVLATAGPQGRWSITVPPALEPRIFGLSVMAGDRQAQAEGYILLTPQGQAALLRAGAGALRIGQPVTPGLRAIDFDHGGGLEVSATVPGGATVIVELDGRQAAEGRADADGHYEVSLGATTPVQPGLHEVRVYGDGFSDTARVQISPAAPLAEGPLRSQLTPAGLRVDWMTPGGGEQSTLLIH